MVFQLVLYRKPRYSLPTDFPWRSIWNPIVPPKLGSFAWEASWGKVLTLDQLKRRGIPLVNRCCLCEENEETIDHLLIHCSRAMMLWDLLLAITNFNWVFPHTVRQLLLAWQSASVGKKTEESLVGSSSLYILDAVDGKEYGGFRELGPLCSQDEIIFFVFLVVVG